MGPQHSDTERREIMYRIDKTRALGVAKLEVLCETEGISRGTYGLWKQVLRSGGVISSNTEQQVLAAQRPMSIEELVDALAARTDSCVIVAFEQRGNNRIVHHTAKGNQQLVYEIHLLMTAKYLKETAHEKEREATTEEKGKVEAPSSVL